MSSVEQLAPLARVAGRVTVEDSRRPSRGRTTSPALILVIPAHRPSEKLPDLVAEVMEDPSQCIQSAVVVDDGSGPECAETFRRLAALPNVTVLRHAVNLGQGAALKTGFNYALVKYPGALGVVAADADGQHAAADIARVARTLVEQPRHIVLGARQFGPDVPLRSRLGNVLTRYIFRLFTGRQVSDTQIGLRGWPREACLRNLRLDMNGFDFQLECLLRAEAPMREIPIQTIYLDGNKSSHFNPVRDSMRIYFLFLRYCGSSLFAAAVDSAVFYPLLFWTGNIALSQFSGRAVAGLANFPVVKNLVFRSGSKVWIALAKYVALLAVSGSISYGLIQFIHAQLALPVAAAKVAAEALLFLGNFVIQRDLIFTKKLAGELVRAASPGNTRLQ